MIEKMYNWTRYWSPRGAEVALDPRGVLINPESEFGKQLNSNLVSLESVNEIPCLILLGEPGIGKSNALESLKRQRANDWQRDGIVWTSLDLRSYGSEDRLVRDLFETDQFRQWLRADTLLMLILDSLDECLLRIDTVATLLADELSKRSVPANRLKMRITCRSAVWPEVLEKGLIRVWGEQAVRVYEMNPLSLLDIAIAAEANRLDVEKFIQVIGQQDAFPLAAKPVTLELLIRLFEGQESLPASPVLLYEQGLRKLCEETNESRRGSRRTGSLSPQQRLAVASRSAAMTILAGRDAIRIGSEEGDVREGDLPFEDIIGGREEDSRGPFDVSLSAVQETLDTGLFASRGLGRLGFFHSTYAEFLAARFLREHEMSAPQVLALITHGADPAARLAPQLHGTAAWLAAMSPDVFRAVIRTDPEVVLRSDVSTATESDRRELVASLLRLYNDEPLREPKLGGRHLYCKLQHSGLAEQVLGYIVDKSKKSLARCEALEIVRFCALKDCKQAALDIFLNTSEEEPVRRTAGYALLAVGDDSDKLRMKALVSGDHPEDIYDELKGLALKALWPNHITALDLFSALSTPKQDSLFGSYSEFLHQLPEALDAADIPEALNWLAEQPPRQSVSYTFRNLMDAIFIRSWDHLDKLSDLESLAKACLARLDLDYRLVDNFPEGKNWIDVVGNRDKRQRVLGVLIQMLSANPDRTALLASSATPLVLNEDLPWLLDLLESGEDGAAKAVVAMLIRMVFRIQYRDQVEQVLTAIERNHVLGNELSWLWKPVALDSPEADKMRADYQRERELNETWVECKRQEEESYNHLLDLLNECEAGKPWLFSAVSEELILRPRPVADRRLLECDLTTLPAWQKADDQVKRRILEAAKNYLLRNDAKPEEWIGAKVYDQAVFAGYKAFRLILSEEPGHLPAVPADVWMKWAPVILAYPTRLGFGDEDTFMHLVSMAFQVAPQAVLDTLLFLIEQENQQDGNVLVTQKIRHCRGPAVEETLLSKLRDDNMTPDSMGALLDELLARNVVEARNEAEALVKMASVSQDKTRQKSAISAYLLVFHKGPAGWRAVWPVIESDEDFGLMVIPRIAAFDRAHGSQLLKSLTEEELGQLFGWLARHYPHAEDPKHEGFHAVCQREEIADWRDSILRELRDRATREAIDTLNQIQNEFPEFETLGCILGQAHDLYRKKSWVPPEPREILEMALDSRKRLVRSPRELLEVVSESLRRLEQQLQGETPAAIFLWDHIEDDQYKPKRETDFSDYLKLHLEKELESRGLVVNREVQIHRGERTDIYVNAISMRPGDAGYDSITVILEVKGCWNDQLWQAMETQLVGQYMTNNPCNTGLYVVGWFNCKHWALKDQQKKKLSKEISAMEISNAQKRLDAQANGLCADGHLLRAVVLDTSLHKG